MSDSFRAKSLLVLGAIGVFLTATLPANSRDWSQNPASLARDYLVINDNRGKGDMVVVMWLAPVMVEGETSQAARDLLENTTLIGVVHGRLAKDGTVSFERTNALEVRDGSGNALTAFDTNTMPPAIVGTVSVLQSVFGRSFGQFGQGMQWFAFNSGAVHACGKGGLSVQYASEKYTYVTPIPGCPR
jgi:hypothetical protein